MTDNAHDMGLMTPIIDGVAHGLAVYGEAFVVLPIDFVPALQSTVDMQRVDTDKGIADDVLAWNDIDAVFAPTAETLTRLGAKAIGPVRDGPVPTHPT